MSSTVATRSFTGPARGQHPGHTTHYLAAGPEDGPPVVFLHGWPELAISWRHQLPALAALGFRTIAPDMRGYGRSSVYRTHDAYAQAHIVQDMLELLDHLGAERAVWVGHDWGSPVAWNIASHHPERCHAVASLCVPYRTIELGLDHVLTLVNRDRYPEDEFPAGQWEYVRYYEEHFEDATAAFDADPRRIATLLFRKGDPASYGKPSGTAFVRKNGGWFGGGPIPELPPDHDVVSAADLEAYAEALGRNGFFGPNSWYMNHTANAAYAATALDDGRLTMPVLFIAAQYDTTCDAVTSALPEPMRASCSDLTERLIYSGHWMAQERPTEVNAVLVEWLLTHVPEVWPRPRKA